MDNFTEAPSLYRHLEHKSTAELLFDINNEDQKVALAVREAIPQIIPVIDVVSEKMSGSGRLFYIGAGTSGRLGVLDASECPPTYGVPQDLVIGLIAGGDVALRNSVENAEDDPEKAWKDLLAFNINANDVVIGIAASGTTPYVVNGVRAAKQNGVVTAGISCNRSTPLSKAVDYAIEVIVGPEYVTGSTRMKSGTAQKMVLNMISTSVMIKLGRVKDNKMVDMMLSNDKLFARGIMMIMENSHLDYNEAKDLLVETKSVRKAIQRIKQI